jgi:hypothetical protein
MRALVLTLLAALPLSCKKDDAGVQLNSPSDCLRVAVVPLGDDDDSAGDDDDSAAPTGDCDPIETIELHPEAGLWTIDRLGTATVSPTFGPAGTEFSVQVLLDHGEELVEQPADTVASATVHVNNGSIDINDFPMEESPGSEWIWYVHLTAGGDPSSTTRCDALCVGLFAAPEE